MLKVCSYFSIALVIWNICGSQAMTREENALQMLLKTNPLPNKSERQMDTIYDKISEMEINVENKQESVQFELENLKDQVSSIQEILFRIEKKILMPYFDTIGTRYFYVNNDFKANWNKAQKYCRKIGGYLATFQNAEEYYAIQSKILYRTEFYWLGIRDFKNDDHFVSVTTGKPAPYLKWGLHQPGDEGNSDCVETYDAKMHDRYCEDRGYFICQADSEI